MKPNNAATLKYSTYGDPATKCQEIHWLYFPSPFDQYVTLCIENNYKLWKEVFELINPFLNRRGIGVISIARTKEAQIAWGQNINSVLLPQAAYLLKNALCHVCAHDWSLTLSHHNGINPVFVKSGSDKMAYDQEKYKSGEEHLDKPEILAQAILDRLGIEEKVKIDTILVGESYGNSFIEMIPDFDVSDKQINNLLPMGVRCDLFENWQFVKSLVDRGARPTVITKNLPPQSIMPFIKGVNKINIWIEKGQEVDTKAIHLMEDLGIQYSFLSRNDDIPDIKLKLFDFKPVQIISPPSQFQLDKLNSMSYDTRIKSQRLLVSGSGTFVSVYHWKNDINVSHAQGAFLRDGAEDQDFINESDLFLYYKLIA